MIFSIVILVLFAVVVYFHWTQGFLSSTLSAVIAAISASLALGWYEVIVHQLLKGKMGDYAAPMVLVGLFALCYGILRAISDKAVPGNVAIPLWLDRAGTILMGIVAGIFSAGVVAIGVQMLPFGPAVMGFSRFDQGSVRDVEVPPSGSGGFQQVDEQVTGELKPDHIGQVGDEPPVVGSSVYLDDAVVSFVSRGSQGLLDNGKPFSTLHPNLLDEIDGNRVGLQPAAKRTALNAPGRSDVTVQKAWVESVVPAADGERPEIRRGLTFKVEPILKAKPDEAIVVIAINVAPEAFDDDHFFRFSTGGIRLVAGDGDARKDYHPLGWLDNPGGLRVQRADDYLVADGSGAPIYLVFLVQKDDVLKESAGGGEAFKDGTLLVVKRGAVVDLTDQAISAPEQVKATSVLKKGNLPSILAGAPTGGATPSATIGKADLLSLRDIEVTNELPFGINPGRYEGVPMPVKFASGSATVVGKQFSKLEVDPTQSINELGQGDFVLKRLAGDPAMPTARIVRVHAVVPPGNSKAWAWAAALKDIQLQDVQQHTFNCHGAAARILPGGVPKIVAKFDATAAVSSLNAAESRPVDVWLFYMVPTGTQIAGLKVGNVLEPKAVSVQ